MMLSTLSPPRLVAGAAAPAHSRNAGATRSMPAPDAFDYHNVLARLKVPRAAASPFWVADSSLVFRYGSRVARVGVKIS